MANLKDVMTKGIKDRPVVVRPLYTGELTYESPDGSMTPIMALTPFPSQIRGRGGNSLMLTPELAERYVRAIRSGNTLKAAAAYISWSEAGIHQLRKFAEAEPILSEDRKKPRAFLRYETEKRNYLRSFFMAVDIARVLGERELLIIIQDAALGNARPTRRFTKERIVVQTKDGPREQVRELEEYTELAPDHRAAMWLLERSDPANYGRQVTEVRAEITGKGGGPIQTDPGTGILSAISAGIQRIAEMQQALPQSAGTGSGEIQDADFTEDDDDE